MDLLGPYRPVAIVTTLDDTLTALADPKRRQVVHLLAESSQSAGTLAASVGLTPPAMSRHLRVLRRAGLVDEQSHSDDARVRVYSLRPEHLTDLKDWLQTIERFWSSQLDAFKNHVENR